MLADIPEVKIFGRKKKQRKLEPKFNKNSNRSDFVHDSNLEIFETKIIFSGF